MTQAPVADVGLIRWLYAFQAWTRPRVLAAAQAVEEGDLRRPGLIPGGHGNGSLLATLVHLVDTEESWLLRWQGRADEDPGYPDPAKYGDLPSVERTWEEVERARADLLERLGPVELARPYPGSTRVPLWQAVLHVANHSTHHRAEICSALAALGSPPESVDMMDFVRASLADNMA